MSKKGKLYLIPVTLGRDDPQHVLSPEVAEIARSLRHFTAENLRSARRFLSALEMPVEIHELWFSELSKRHPLDEQATALEPLKTGDSMGLLSEAGVPGVADPGAEAVAWAHKNDIPVVPLTGPSSILLALMASGFGGQQFTFHGYLPIDRKERIKALKDLEAKAQSGYTQIFMETPYRNNKLLDDLLKNGSGNTWLSIAADITLETEFIGTRKLADWKKQKPDLHKRPCIFCLGKPH